MIFSLLLAASVSSPIALENAPTVAALTAVETHWSRAFVTGDETYLGELLTADYVSVGANGEPHSRESVLTAAHNYALAHPNATDAKIPDQHMLVRIEGTTGIVTFNAGGHRSVDVFYYADGRWHAWYSQHTNQSTQTHP